LRFLYKNGAAHQYLCSKPKQPVPKVQRTFTLKEGKLFIKNPVKKCNGIDYTLYLHCFMSINVKVKVRCTLCKNDLLYYKDIGALHQFFDKN